MVGRDDSGLGGLDSRLFAHALKDIGSRGGNDHDDEDEDSSGSDASASLSSAAAASAMVIPG